MLNFIQQTANSINSTAKCNGNAIAQLISRHVGKTDIELVSRLNSEVNLRMASSFTDLPTAEKAISVIIYNNSKPLSDFMASNQNRLVLTGDAGFSVGKIIDRGSLSSMNSNKATVVIVKDSAELKGWRVLTAFPDK